MKKKVKITINSTPITNISTGVIMVRGTYSPMELDVEDIFKCICGKAIVEEVLDNGKIIPLTLSNYNKDNNKLNDDGEKPIGIPPITYDSHAQPEFIKPDLSQSKNLVNPEPALINSLPQPEQEQDSEEGHEVKSKKSGEVTAQEQSRNNKQKGNSYKK